MNAPRSCCKRINGRFLCYRYAVPEAVCAYFLHKPGVHDDPKLVPSRCEFALDPAITGTSTKGLITIEIFGECFNDEAKLLAELEEI